VSVRRKLALSVAAYDTAQAERAGRARVEAEERARTARRNAERKIERAAETRARRAEARRELERRGCYAHAAAVTRYLARGEARQVERYFDSTLAIYASAR
jgi:hypothetical protein